MDKAHKASDRKKHMAIVDQRILGVEVSRQKQSEPEQGESAYDPIGSEPVLREYLNGEMLRTCGNMSLNVSAHQNHY